MNTFKKKIVIKRSEPKQEVEESEVKEIREDIETEEDEKGALLQVYDPKEDYYLDNYIKYASGRVYKGIDLDDALDKAEKDLRPLLGKIMFSITGKTCIKVGKISEEEPFKFGIDISAIGLYKGFPFGKFTLEYKDGRKDERVKYGIFFFVNCPNYLYRGVVNKPYHWDIGYELGNFVNVFPCFKADFYPYISYQEAEEICQPILDHILNIWANGNKEYYNYQLEWLFYIIRELKRSEIMLTIRGKQGIGKGIIFKFIEQFVAGPGLAITISGIDAITGEFNILIANKLFVFVDETAILDSAKGKSLKQFESLKHQITTDKIRITRKGIDSIMIDSYVNYGHATNNYNSLIVEEGDRRHAIFDGCGEVPNQEYFENLGIHLNQITANAFYTMARLSKPLANLKNIPMTEIKQEFQKNSKPKGAIFFHDVFVEGSFPITSDRIKIRKNKIYVPTMDMYSLYKIWHRNSNNGIFWGSDLFSKQIREFLGVENSGRISIDKQQKRCIIITENLYDKVVVSKDTGDISLRKYLEEHFNEGKAEED